MADQGRAAAAGGAMAGSAVKQEPGEASGSGAPWSSATGAPWPAGMKVLVVDDDPLCLKVVSLMLQKCDYKATLAINGKSALDELRKHPDNYDLVLSDVYMPDMDGFKLLEHINFELNLPVIMMSSNGNTDVVLRGVTHGAVDFLIKPVRLEELRNAWQHVVRRKRELADRRGDSEEHDDEDAQRVANERKRKSSDDKRRSADDEGGDEGGGAGGGSSAKKARVVWSVDMHQQFVSAVNFLGVDKAVPKRILDVMNVAGLTRENVASHLQKYRLYLRKMNNVPPGQRGNKQMPGLVPNSPQDPHQLQHQHQQLALQQQQQQAAAAGQAASLAPPVAAAAVSAQMGMPPIVGTAGMAFQPQSMATQQAGMMGGGPIPDHILRMQMQRLHLQAMTMGGVQQAGLMMPGAPMPGAMPMPMGPYGHLPHMGIPAMGMPGALSGSGLTAGLEYGMPPPGTAMPQGIPFTAAPPAATPAASAAPPAADMSWLLAGGGSYPPHSEPPAPPPPLPPRHGSPLLHHGSPQQPERRNSLNSSGSGRRVSFEIPVAASAAAGGDTSSRPTSGGGRHSPARDVHGVLQGATQPAHRSPLHAAAGPLDPSYDAPPGVGGGDLGGGSGGGSDFVTSQRQPSLGGGPGGGGEFASQRQASLGGGSGGVHFLQQQRQPSLGGGPGSGAEFLQQQRQTSLGGASGLGGAAEFMQRQASLGAGAGADFMHQQQQHQQQRQASLPNGCMQAGAFAEAHSHQAQQQQPSRHNSLPGGQLSGTPLQQYQQMTGSDAFPAQSFDLAQQQQQQQQESSHQSFQQAMPTLDAQQLPHAQPQQQPPPPQPQQLQQPHQYQQPPQQQQQQQQHQGQGQPQAHPPLQHPQGPPGGAQLSQHHQYVHRGGGAGHVHGGPIAGGPLGDQMGGGHGGGLGHGGEQMLDLPPPIDMMDDPGLLGPPTSGGYDHGGGVDTMDDMLDFFLKDEPILD